MWKNILMKKLKYLCFKRRNRLFVRGSRGFGIHSPFVFNLITGVFKDKSKYYAFDEMLEVQHNFNKRELKYSKLIYRLANHLKINSIYGNNISCSNELKLLSKLHSNIIIKDILSVEDCPEFLLLGKKDFDLYIKIKTDLINVFKEKGVTIVIKDMYKYDRLFAIWSQLKDECIVSIDLFHLGILFFNKKLQKGNYTANI